VIERIAREHVLPRAPFADLLHAFSPDVVK
jgi:hypothetical protein